uniref:Uncharacterized protein n=1 Tax=Timema douglasi TaxID=61478 RepID=A0A7R8Z8R5_TIMDO|nr:unnamed protein product [Timema douglasi]
MDILLDVNASALQALAVSLVPHSPNRDMDNVQAGDGKTQIPVSLHTLQISGGQAFILQQVLSRARHKNGNNLPAKSPQPVITLHFAMPEFTQATSASAINVTLAQAGAKQILDNTSSTRSGVLCEEAHADGDNININSGNVSLVTIGQHEAGNYSFPPTLWSPWHPLDISTFTMIGAPASRPLNSLMSLSSLAPTIITGQKQLTGLPETLYPGVESRELEERGHSIDLNQHLGLILNQMEMYSTSLTANRNRSNCANSILLKNNLYADDSRVNVSSMDDKMTIANAEEDTNINTLVDELLWRYSELPIDELIKELPSDDYSVNTLTEDKGHSALHFINNVGSVKLMEVNIENVKQKTALSILQKRAIVIHMQPYWSIGNARVKVALRFLYQVDIVKPMGEFIKNVKQKDVARSSVSGLCRSGGCRPSRGIAGDEDKQMGRVERYKEGVPAARVLRWAVGWSSGNMSRGSSPGWVTTDSAPELTVFYTLRCCLALSNEIKRIFPLVRENVSDSGLGADYSGESVTDGSENMDYEAVQAVGRVVGTRYFYRPAPLRLFREQIRWTDSVKHLGLTLDTKLTW